MTHLWEEHEDKLKQILVTRCPDCGMQFNKARIAEHHILCKHKQKYTLKEIIQLIKQMKQNADPANKINWEDKFWTTKLREAECFAGIGKTVRSCFTCSISVHQNKCEIQGNPPKWELVNYPKVVKITQVIQLNSCPKQNMTRDEFNPTDDKDVLLGWSDVFKSAYYTYTEDGDKILR